MATRKQRALKLEKRREAQKHHRGRTRREETKVAGRRQVIEIAAGPKPTPGFHRTDPMRHGEELRRREQVVTFCDRIGFQPTREQIDKMTELMREGRLTEAAIEHMANPLHRLERGFDQSMYGFSAVDGKTGERVDPRSITRVHSDEVELLDKDRLRETVLGTPTEEEWAELEATAKRKRRGAKGFIKVLTDAGYMLNSDLGPDADPKTRESWMRA